MAQTIGEAAGKVWHCLEGNGALKVTDLPRKCGVSKDMVQRAIGWLAREDKIIIEAGARGESVALKA